MLTAGVAANLRAQRQFHYEERRRITGPSTGDITRWIVISVVTFKPEITNHAEQNDEHDCHDMISVIAQ